MYSITADMMEHMSWWNSDQTSVKLELEPAPSAHMASPVLGGGPLMVTIPKSPCNLLLPSHSSAMRVVSAGSPISTPSPVSTPSPSPKSPSSWQESFQELSRSLQQICGSPTKELGNVGLTHAALRRGNSCGPKMTTSPISPNPEAAGRGPNLMRSSSASTSQEQLQQQQQQQQQQPEQNADSAKRSSRCADFRNVLVRHEESEKTLKKKLEAIWQGTHSSGDESDSPDSGNGETTHRRSKCVTRRESLCGNCFRVQVNLLNHPLDYVSVGVDRKMLRVVSWRNPNSAVTLLETRLPPYVDLEKLDCYIQEGAVFIKERSRRRLHIGELSGHKETTVIYLPIIWEDTNSGQVKIVQHVPKELSQFQLQVKTMDERLVVSTRVTAGCLQQQQQQQQYPPPNLTVAACFSRIMQLPERVHPRSVSAAISKNNQLIIWGNLEPRHRLHTC